MSQLGSRPSAFSAHSRKIASGDTQLVGNYAGLMNKIILLRGEGGPKDTPVLRLQDQGGSLTEWHGAGKIQR